MPAMPGSVSVAPSSDSDGDDQRDVDGERDVGEDAETAVGDDHEDDDQHGADDARRSCRLRSNPAPRLGPTVRSSMMVSFAGSAPARSSTARSLALSTVKLPEIWPEPPRIGSRIRGAEITWLSSTMANGRPTFSCVAWPKRCAPLLSKRKETTGSLVRWSKPGCASIEVLARHDDAVLDQIGRPAGLRCRVQNVGVRPAAGRCMRLLAPASTGRPSGRSAWRSGRECP